MRNPFTSSATEWLIVGAVAAIGLTLVALVRALVRRKLRLASQTQSEFDDFALDLADRTSLMLLALPALVIAEHLIADPLPGLRGREYGLFRMGAKLSFIAQAALWVSGLADLWLRRYRRTRVEHDPSSQTTVHLFRVAIVVTVWVIAVLMALRNLGFEVGPALAGLGIGGIAVALALQNILGDLFASLSIVIDKPFVVGDSIMVDQDVGTVEQIGLKTTRVRSVSGEELIFSNGDLLKSRIRNFKRMTQRRSLSRIGVARSTSIARLERIPQIVQAIVERQKGARFDRAHLLVVSAAAHEFEIVYFVESPEYRVLLDVQQAVNLELVRSFAAEGIELAPTAGPPEAPAGRGKG